MGIESIYQDADHYDWLAARTAPADLPFYESWAERYPGAILELGCGTGRLSLALAKKGYDVTGLERSEALLQAARVKAERDDIAVVLTQGDMRSFELGIQFALVLCPYNAFNHLLTLDEVKNFLAHAAKHLPPTGRLLIDTIQPDPAFLGANPSLKVLEYTDPRTGEPGVLFEDNHYDSAHQVNQIVWRYVVGGQLVRRDELQMRMFFPQELDALVRLCGWSIEAKWGSYDGRAFGAQMPKQLLILAPPGQREPEKCC